MAGFIYNGHSTEDFLSDNITVAFLDGASDGYGVQREMQAGSPTLFRPIPNEYGTLENPQEIEFAILKCNGSSFTKEEQVKIETWLTAPKLSTPLYFVPNGKKAITGPTPYYYGIFTNTLWIPGGKGFSSVTLSFKPTTTYPFIKTTTKVNLTGNQIQKKISLSKFNSDDYVYPVITLKDNSGNFSIQNISTGDNVMSLTGISSINNLCIDCKNCIITDLDNQEVLSFSDIGWTTVGDIVWLKLCQDKNVLEINGNASVTISYETPYKKVGGWFE